MGSINFDGSDSYIMGFPDDWQAAIRESDGCHYKWRIAKKGEILRVHTDLNRFYDLPLEPGEMLHQYYSNNICRMEPVEVA